MADKLWIMVVICGSWRLQVDHGSYRWILAVICMWIMAVINYGVDARGATASKKLCGSWRLYVNHNLDCLYAAG